LALKFTDQNSNRLHNLHEFQLIIFKWCMSILLQNFILQEWNHKLMKSYASVEIKLIYFTYIS
jgi:hypothetical protein